MTNRITHLPFYVAALAAAGCSAPDYKYEPPKPPEPECIAETPLSAAAGLRVQGNRITDAAGQEVRFRGVNRAGSEYKCVQQGSQVFDGTVDDAAIAAMVKWNINSVRIPLNEDCWLAINGVANASSGANYQNAIADYVSRLHTAGLYAIVELHWSAPGTYLADGATNQQPAPDADHSPAFWSSVAERFKDDKMMVFDLYNEPFMSNKATMGTMGSANIATISSDPWTCWRDGCTINASKGITTPWQSAGMQTLLDAIRATGAEQLVLVGGIDYSNDLSLWRSYRPHDALCNVAPAYHQYDKGCTNEQCWDYRLKAINNAFPLITGEVGETDCAHGFLDTYLAWADAHRISYLAWAWNASSCANFPALIQRYDGTPSNFGIGYRDHLLSTPP